MSQMCMNVSVEHEDKRLGSLNDQLISLQGWDTYVHTYIHTYIRTYVHTYIHTYIHTHMQKKFNAIAATRWSCSPGRARMPVALSRH